MNKEENRYYTPTIEEFHVGFEYEKNEPHRIFHKENMPVEYRWVEKTWNEKQDRIGTLRYKITEKNIRVKYLDQEDIKSLGFEENIYGYWLNNKLLTFDNSEKTPYVVISNGETQTDEVFYFKGNIKNKSELVKLLKQLGIYE